MEQRQSQRLHGLDAEIVPETARDQHCIFCFIDEHHGFNIIAGNVLRFPCCKNLHTAVAKENGRETRHNVHTVAENCPAKEMMDCLWKLLNRVTDIFHRGSEQ